MTIAGRRLVAVLLVVLATTLASGCELGRRAVDPALAVGGEGIGPLYPGGEVRCADPTGPARTSS